jgi:hypothetical protein
MGKGHISHSNVSLFSVSLLSVFILLSLTIVFSDQKVFAPLPPSAIISSVSFSPTSGLLGVGDTITMTISTDGAVYTASAISVNGKDVTASNFVNNLDNTYSVDYIIVEGDTDVVDAAQISVSVVLSNIGSLNAPFTTSPAAGNSPAIDANSPILFQTSITPSSGVVPIGGTVTLDFAGGETGLAVVTAVVNGEDVSASLVDNGGGLYTVTYTVAEGEADSSDASTLPVSIVLEDAAGNDSNAINDGDEVLAGNSPGVDANRPTITSFDISRTDGTFTDTNPERTFSTSVELVTVCDDGLAGSGCDTFVVGGTGLVGESLSAVQITSPRPATLTAGRDLAKSAEISSVTDIAGNVAIPTAEFTDTIALDARILTVDPSTTTPFWEVDLFIDGIVENALPDDKVKVDFGSPTVVDPTIVTWVYNVTNQYPQISLDPDTNPHKPNATLTDVGGTDVIDSIGTRVSTLGPDVTVQKHPTSISADSVTNPSAGNRFFVGGTLFDTLTAPVQVTGKSISFENTGAPASLLDVTTQGMTFADPDFDGVNIVDNIMRLNAGSSITPARGTIYVGLHIEDMGDATITLRVTSTASTTNDYTVNTLSTNPVLFTASDPSGIDNILILSVTGSPDVGLSSVKTYGQELGLIHDIDFAPSDPASSFTYDAGRFYSEGTSQSTATSSALSLDEKFYEDSDYLGYTKTVLYTVLESTTAGVGGSTSATADSGVGIASVLCAAGTGTGANQDTDSDSLCNSWEASGTASGSGVPFTVGGTQYYYALTGTTTGGKDILFEIDAMTSHTPDSTALANVRTAFAAEGVNLIHTLGELTIPHLDLIKLWTDTDLIDANDYNSLKNDYYGTPSERPVMSLQTAQVSTSITTTSVKLGSGGGSGITISIPTNSITSGATQGTIVAKIKTTVTVSNEKHRDTGATANVFDVGEAVYRDVDYSGTVTIGDIRLVNPPSPYTAGSVVASADTDLTGALVSFATLEKHRDNGAILGLFDVGEAIYKDTDATNTVTAGGTPDIRLANPPTGSAGSAVAAGNTDITGTLVAFAPYLTVGTITQPSSPAGLTLGTITASVSSTSTSTQKIVTITIPFTTTGPISTTAIPEITIPFNSVLSTAQVTAGVTNPGSPAVFTTLLNAKAQAVRYAIWAHSYGGPSGQSELKGNDLAVTLGAGFGGTLAAHTGSIGTTNEQAGTYMHELGHILNLQHGGADTNNCKPNYFSIMSYSRQLETYLAGAWALSFSQGGRLSLAETALNEAVGLGGPGTGTTVYGSPVVSPATATATIHALPDHTFHSVAGNAATIDWDDSGTASGTVTADINNFGFSGCTASTPSATPYADYDDSTLFSFNFRDAPSGQFDGITIFQSDADGKVRSQGILGAGTFDGLDSPIPNNKAKPGSTVPIKLDITTGPTQVIDVPNIHGRVYVSFGNINGPYTQLTNQLTNTNDVLWVPSTHQIQFNWKTKATDPEGPAFIKVYLLENNGPGFIGNLGADFNALPGNDFLKDLVTPFKLKSGEKHVDNVSGTANVFNVGEGIYDDLDSSNTVSVGDKRLANPPGGLLFVGSIVKSGNSDVGKALVAFASNEKHRDNNGEDNSGGLFDIFEGIYRDVDSSGTVSVGDIRLANPPFGFASGSTVASGNSDVGKALVPFVFAVRQLATDKITLDN